MLLWCCREVSQRSRRPEGGGGAARPRARGVVAGSASLLVEAVAKAPGLGAGVDDVGAVGEAVDDGLGEAGVVEDLGPFTEGQVGGDDQAAAFVAFGEDLEDELGGAVGQREVAEFVEDDELGACVATDHAREFATAL